MKKKVSFFLATGLSLVLSSTVLAATNLTDLDKSYAKDQIRVLVDEGIVSGYDDNTFKPEQDITRQEFAKLLCKALNLQEDANSSKKFTDVADWARPFVGALYKAKITEGTGDTTFGATDKLTREQMATFFVRAMKMEEQATILYQGKVVNASFKDEGQVSDYAKGNVAFAQKIGFIQGDGVNFFPKTNSQRQAVALLVCKYVKDFESVYVPQIMKLELPDATEITRTEEGTFTALFPEKEGLLYTEMNFTPEEIAGGGCIFYNGYRHFLSEGNTKDKWEKMPSSEKETFFQAIVLSWSLADCEQAITAEKVDSVASLQRTAQELITAVDDFYTNEEFADSVLDEETMTAIAIDAGILVDSSDILN